MIILYRIRKRNYELKKKNKTKNRKTFYVIFILPGLQICRQFNNHPLSLHFQVQLAFETSKSFKEDRSAGGDVALMKSEIHKMEMRLSHLRKVQEKLIHDMDFCISRRDVIMDGALAKEKKNPKGVHNQRVILRKRLDDRKVKIKQIANVSFYEINFPIKLHLN